MRPGAIARCGSGDARAVLGAVLLVALTAGGLSGCGWVRVEGSPPRGPAPAASGPSVAQDGTVVVQRGDTLYSIARRHDVPLRSMIVANGLEPPYRLLPGDRLTLPPPPRMHRVVQGDTVYGISRRYGVDVTSLVRANEIAPPYTIVLGQALIVPDGDLDTVAAGSQPPVETASIDRSVEVAPLPPPSGHPLGRQPAGEAIPDGATSGGPTPGESAPAEPAAERPAASERPPEVAARSPAQPSEPLSGPMRFIKPVDGRIVSTYGPKAGGLHNDGINIAAPRGTPVRAAEDGVVAYAGNELAGFGHLILVRHADGWTTAYGHNEALLVKRGDRVARGQAIARVGATGNVSTPQLHFEIRRGTRAVDPMPHLGGTTRVSALPAHHQPVPSNLIALQTLQKAEAQQ